MFLNSSKNIYVEIMIANLYGGEYDLNKRLEW